MNPRSLSAKIALFALTGLLFLSALGAVPADMRGAIRKTLGSLERYYAAKKPKLYDSQPIGWRKKIIPMSSVFYAARRAVMSQYKKKKWQKTSAFIKRVQKAGARDEYWLEAAGKYGPRFIRLVPGKRGLLENSAAYYKFVLTRMDFKIFRKIQKIRKCCPSYDIYSPRGQKLTKELHRMCRRKGMPLPPIVLKSRDGYQDALSPKNRKGTPRAWEFKNGTPWSTYHLNEWMTFMQWVARRADAAGVRNKSDYERFRKNMLESMTEIEKQL